MLIIELFCLKGGKRMAVLQYIKDYRDNKELRESFFELANNVFGLNFVNWYEKGFWGSNYVPYSYIDDNKVIANVSINIIDMIVHGTQHRALQVGTVMTHPEYRNRGLSEKLMNKVLAEYKDSYDIMYLFANDSVLDFYPKFGFDLVEEYQYFTTFTSEIKSISKLRKLDVENNEDINFIY